jgi:large subunit ribosomal protein L23Ae
VKKAHKFARQIKKGRNNAVKFQAYRTSPTFQRSNRRLKTQKRNPKYARKSIVRQSTWDKFTILKQPKTSERFYKKMETENTIVFIVDKRASKKDISKAFLEQFGVKPQRINTLHTPLGPKKAYIKLPKTTEATEIANKMGLL